MIYIWHWKTIENPHKSSNRPCDGRIAAIKKTIKTAESQRPFNIVRCSEWFFKGLFTRYDFVACDKLTTGLRHELFRVNQTYNSLTTLKSCRRPVVSLSHATKSCRVNRP